MAGASAAVSAIQKKGTAADGPTGGGNSSSGFLANEKPGGYRWGRDCAERAFGNRAGRRYK